MIIRKFSIWKNVSLFLLLPSTKSLSLKRKVWFEIEAPALALMKFLMSSWEIGKLIFSSNRRCVSLIFPRRASLNFNDLRVCRWVDERVWLNEVLKLSKRINGKQTFFDTVESSRGLETVTMSAAFWSVKLAVNFCLFESRTWRRLHRHVYWAVSFSWRWNFSACASAHPRPPPTRKVYRNVFYFWLQFDTETLF